MKLPRIVRRVASLAVLSAACAGALVACGGATSTVDAFVPTRLIVFGDETSALVDSQGSGNGLHYGINRISSTTNATSCTADGSKVWTQRLADHYGMVFAECNPDQVTATAYMKARYGALVATLEASIDAFDGILDGAFSSTDMVTVTFGLHDVIQVYVDPSYNGSSEKKAEAKRRGALLAAQVNRLMNMGVKVLVTQVIDVGQTPWASTLGSSEADLLSELSSAFNEGLRTDLINDGTRVGLLAFDDVLRTYMKNTTYDHYSLACDSEHVEDISNDDTDGDGYIDGGGKLLTCTANTLTSDDALTKYVWADSLRVNGSLIQVQFGTLAVNRVNKNPFQ